MIVGVVSDTHNNINNINNIINIFNNKEVNLVIHTGDISKPETLRLFSELDCPMVGVFGNNDRIEAGLKEVCRECNFNFQEPPLLLTLEDKKVAVFHEPELIDSYIKEHTDVQLIVHGHTHRFRDEVFRKTYIFNPGECAGIMKGMNKVGIIDTEDISMRTISF